eukprot:TRINITY_DN8166_c0_g1_i1.p1 TRINITY_DN8166_c0_g1~~TRINITY_DN8166_c0_g1_i1.p1  ORF type:complete len:197 (+),score=48.42 TRINITY_DN8166_c0_g1_i1:119-709(+)
MAMTDAELKELMDRFPNVTMDLLEGLKELGYEEVVRNLKNWGWTENGHVGENGAVTAEVRDFGGWKGKSGEKVRGGMGLERVPKRAWDKNVDFAKVAIFITYYGNAFKLEEEVKMARRWWSDQLSLIVNDNVLERNWESSIIPVPSALQEFLNEIQGDEVPLDAFYSVFCSVCHVRTEAFADCNICPNCTKSEGHE